MSWVAGQILHLAQTTANCMAYKRNFVKASASDDHPLANINTWWYWD